MLLMVSPALAGAHDYWLQADDYQLDTGQRLVVHLNMGESLAVQEEKVYERERTERFEQRFADDVKDLLATTADGAKPLYAETLQNAGPFLFTLVRNSALIEMDAAEFNEYVAHEGVAGVQSQRARERERYWRFLKLLGRSGDVTETDLHHRFTGAQFEIVLLQSPFTMHVGDEQIVQLLFETRPLPNATVFALHRAPDGSLTELRSVTDARGVVRFALAQSGMWLVRAVHMRPCKGCKDADWESFWASYSFALE